MRSDAYLETLNDAQLESVIIPHRSGDPIILATMFEMFIFAVSPHGGQTAYFRGCNRVSTRNSKIEPGLIIIWL